MIPTTSEQALLELVETAEAPEFRSLQSMLKDAKRKSAVGVGACPRLEDYRRTLLPVVGERDEKPAVALLALGKIHLLCLRPSGPGQVGRGPVAGL